MPSEVKRLCQLEDENAKLKLIVADLSLDKAMLQDILQKCMVRPVVITLPSLAAAGKEAGGNVKSAVG